MPVFGIDTGGILLEQIVIVPPCCLLEQVNGFRIVQVFFLIAPFLVPAHAAKSLVHAQIVGVKGTLVHGHAAFCNIVQIDTAYAADCIRKILVHNALADAQCLENFGALIGLNGGDTHFRSDLNDTGNQCVDICLACLRIVLIHQTAVNHVIQGIQCQIRIDCTCTEAQQGCEMMYFTRLCSFDDQRNCSILSGTYQIGFQCSHCQQRRDRQVVVIDTTVGQNQNRCTLGVCFLCLLIQVFNGIMERNVLGIQHGNVCGFQSVNVHAADLHHVQIGENRVVDFQYTAVPFVFFQNVAGYAQINGGIGDDRFPNGVDRRVGDLCEHLLEVIKQRRILLGHCRNRGICTHCRSRFSAVQCHRHHNMIQGLISIAECTL